MRCGCQATAHTPASIAITGGPGAGKTALIQLVRAGFCEHVAVVPESATILYSGGFPRPGSVDGRRVVQRAIFEVQRQLERLVLAEARPAIALCDRGSLDGLAYWPGDEASFFAEMGTDHARELARYAAVIHLTTPADGEGYSHANPVRHESPDEARALDQRLLAVWGRHPAHHVVAAHRDFVTKLDAAVRLIRALVPPCCCAAA
jgi:predicted ATPase